MNLYLVPTITATFPQITDAQGNPTPVNVPKYSDSDIAGQSYTSIPLAGSGLALIRTAANAALAAEADVFAFPSDDQLSTNMSDADIAALTAVLSAASVPTDFLVVPISYASAARTIGQVAQVLQAAAGQGSPITLGSTNNRKIHLGGVSQGSDLLTQAAQIEGDIKMDVGDGFAL